MRFKDKALDVLMQDSAFVRFLLSQGISNLGDSFRFIAVTMLLLKLTGSGISTSLGLIFSILPSLVLSPFAGTVGDILPEKYLMALIDAVRGTVIILFVFNSKLEVIFLLIIVLSALETVYSPLRRKLVLRIAGKDGVLNANSILTGFSGVAFLIGPLLAGFLTEAYGTGPAFSVAGISFLFSSGLILSIKTRRENLMHSLHRKSGFFEELSKGFSYVRNNRPVIEIVFTGIIAAFCSISMNMAFYPFAFDVLKLDSKEWSFLVSVYYGTNLFAMFISFMLGRNMKQRPWKIIYAGFAITALLWGLYGFTSDFSLVLVFQFIEGTVLAVCGILLSTLMQTTAKKGYVARVSGISDITAGAGRIAGMACAYAIIMLESYRSVFILNAGILLLFVLLKLLRPGMVWKTEA
ncbi:MAG: MFS transporter [Ruminiclostridium sp.]|nr:MFS transporter [Ruminiclostridium sp.]